MPRARKRSAKVINFLKKTTGLCPSRCHYSTIYYLLGVINYKPNIYRSYPSNSSRMSGSYPYGERSPLKSSAATCRMDSCLLDPQQELLVAYRENNIRYR